jgi:hypothetical protein
MKTDAYTECRGADRIEIEYSGWGRFSQGELIRIFRSHIDETKRIFMSLPVHATKTHAQTEQIQIEVDRLKLGNAA